MLESETLIIQNKEGKQDALILCASSLPITENHKCLFKNMLMQADLMSRTKQVTCWQAGKL